jgi:hypothetical protein
MLDIGITRQPGRPCKVPHVEGKVEQVIIKQEPPDMKPLYKTEKNLEKEESTNNI